MTNINELIKSGRYRLIEEYKSERMQLLIKPSTKKELKKIAEHGGISLNELVNRILESFIDGAKG